MIILMTVIPNTNGEAAGDLGLHTEDDAADDKARRKLLMLMLLLIPVISVVITPKTVIKMMILLMTLTYLIFVIFLHRHNFWKIKFTPKFTR